MKKLTTLALCGVQMLALAAAVQAANPSDDAWADWERFEITELNEQVIDNQIVENMKIQLSDLEIETTRTMPEDGEGEGTFEFKFNDLSEGGPKVVIPEDVTYEEFKTLLTSAYPELEGSFEKIEDFKVDHEEAQSEFDKEFDKGWEEQLAERHNIPVVDIPEDATEEERREILVEAYPELEERFEEMDQLNEKFEKQREEFHAEFEKEWENAEIIETVGEELIPEGATFEEARDTFLEAHPEMADEFKNWDKSSWEEPTKEAPADK